MTPARWQQVKQLFDAAVSRSPQERARLLDEACASDETLRREVEVLLESHEHVASFMEKPAIKQVAEAVAGGAPQLAVGNRLKPYKIISLLGVGGMGEVYLAEDEKLRRRVALKLLPAEFCRDSSRALRFVREAQVASALNHPNIITIYEINDECETPFIAMEYVEGETLDAKIKGRGFDLPGALDIALQVSEALSEAHARGIIHRDIKPSNIILNRRGQAKILDFGLAKKIVTESEAETQQLLSQTGVLLGTVSYMSPEQARGLQVDARTDVWSLGVVLYEMLAGDRPFAGETTTDVLAAILRSEPAGLRKVNPEIPAGLERIVLKALRKDRDWRYESAKGLYDDLRQLKEGLELPTAREGKTSADAQADAETKVFKARATAVTEAHRSIAVLPFVNMSADAENEYFCDGLAEEILNALAKIDELKVAARTSAFAFKGENAPVTKIGSALNVETVLEGSVRKSGDRVRITVQLAKTSDGYHLWSERYDREIGDIFDVQDEITLAVVAALKVKLFGEERAAVLRRYTDNPEAYQLYLKGRYFFNKLIPAAEEKGIEYFEQAIKQDSQYALAYAGIADCHIVRAILGVLPPNEAFTQAKAAATKALEIDPRLAEAYASLAFSEFYYDWNWAGAEKGFRRALDLNPNFARAYFWYGIYLAAMGRFSEAITEAKRAQSLDPLSLIVNTGIGFIYHWARSHEEALEQLRKTVEIHPAEWLPHFWLGQVNAHMSAHGDAITEYRRALQINPNDTITAASLAHVYALSGDRKAAERILEELKALSQRQYVAPYFIAIIYLGLGDREQTFLWLERAFADRSTWVSRLKVEPWFDSIRADPRFQDLLRRVGFPSPAK